MESFLRCIIAVSYTHLDVYKRQTEDGTAIRDYIYVVDLAKAHVAALKKLISENSETVIDIYNLGTGKGSSVLDLSLIHI